MNIAVLLTCYNRAETTKRCLKALFGQRCNATLSVFLVDDCSPDETGAKIKSAFPQVNVIKGTGLLFWCRGMNLAWKTAGGSYDAYLWLNDDVVLAEDALAGILEDAESVGWRSAVVGSFVDGNGKMTYGVLENWKWIMPMGKPLLTDGDISGNLVLVPKCVVDKIGIIADCYSHAYGDYDYSARMRKAGIPYYLASKICGRCDNVKPDYALESKSLRERVKCLFQPNGHNWKDAIVYRWRNYGLLRTLITAVHVPYLVIRGGKRSEGSRHLGA